MPLIPGARIGPYEILCEIGAGGMGEVYRARDTKLDRDVAIKILPDSFAHDPERLARFEREAKTLASLNHPNIAIVHGFEEADGIKAIVMELVEGQTLEETLAPGSRLQASAGRSPDSEARRPKRDGTRSQGLPVDEALSVARQIAAGLEAAHEHGIVHRDLKPANIKIRPDGTVRILDFGLAKAFTADHASSPSAAALSHSPTITSPVGMTGVGVLLGTAAYMSPEQARGKPVDKRADVWAFGAVLYEMLTGRRAFEGEDISLTLAEVMKSEPDWHRLPGNVPPNILTALKRCLRKDPKERLHDIADVRLLMEGALDAADGAASVAPRPLWRRATPIGIAALVFAAIGALATWSVRPATPLPVMRSVFTLPEGQTFTNAGRSVVAISPDGAEIAYVANSRMYLRSMSELEAKPIPGTDIPQGVLNPIFSPDGQSIAFWSAADGTIKRIGVSGGAPVTLCEATRPFGMSWQGDVIVFGQGGGGISRVSARGGKPEVLVGVKDGELAHGPQILPDGQAVLFTLARGTASDRWDKAQIVLHQLSSGDRKTLIDGGSDARYVPTGHLVYALAGVLFAVPFDLARLEVTGGPVPIVQGVRRADIPEGNSGVAHFGFSNTGSLIHIPGPESTASGTRDLAFLDRKGSIEPLKLPPGSYETPRVSPDGKRIAYSNGIGNEQAIYVHELAGASSPRRLTFGGRNRFPLWSADGARVAFQSDREGDLAIFWQRADGTDSATRLTKPDSGIAHIPESWSPSGDTMLFDEFGTSVTSSWTFSLRDKKAEPFGGIKTTTLVTSQAVFSPDGQWVAYRSNETGSSAVYVQPFPATGAKYQITNGNSPAWSPDGKEIFFFSGGQFGVLSIGTRPSVTFGNRAPVPAPRFQLLATGPTPRLFDIAADGRIIGPIDAEQSQPGTPTTPRIHIVVNWFEELKARAPRR